jgi:N6-L-threonylcarbamoyladenine synthase
MPAPALLPVTVLGIETSCDETAAAIVRLMPGGDVQVLSERVYSQSHEHDAYGGVVPEIAARAHVEKADGVVGAVLREAGLLVHGLDAVAATAGPGLIGGVMVGMMTGKALALAGGVPFLPVNHLEGHALSPRLTGACDFPYLLLLVSGGHCQFVMVEGLGRYRRLGASLDDAAGEAFDKTARVLGLTGSGGPQVERMARLGDPEAVALPRPLIERGDLTMSFAGLKTAVLRAAQAEPLSDARIADLCASFQRAVADILAVKARLALRQTGAPRLVVAGGVAANGEIRTRLQAECAAQGAVFHAPPLKWCTDNGAMIALAGALHLQAGAQGDLGALARPRWPLDAHSALAEPALGGGKKGAKA